MKKILFLTVTLFYFAIESVFSFDNNHAIERTTATDILDSIQYKIEYAMNESFSKGSTEPLDKIFGQLQQIKQQNNVITYWMAYVNYYQSVYFLKTTEKKKSETKIKEGIILLEELKRKNSEDYALLAILQSFYIQFKSGMAAGKISSKVTENGEKAIELDSLNLRAWYVLGSNDFYTPESFGGGKKAEGYLKKAITLPSQSTESIYLPSWGKEYAFEMLIQFYIKKDKKDEAKKIYDQAIQQFPDSYMLKQYESKF